MIVVSSKLSEIELAQRIGIGDTLIILTTADRLSAVFPLVLKRVMPTKVRRDCIRHEAGEVKFAAVGDVLEGLYDSIFTDDAVNLADLHPHVR